MSNININNRISTEVTSNSEIDFEAINKHFMKEQAIADQNAGEMCKKLIGNSQNTNA